MIQEVGIHSIPLVNLEEDSTQAEALHQQLLQMREMLGEIEHEIYLRVIPNYQYLFHLGNKSCNIVCLECKEKDCR